MNKPTFKASFIASLPVLAGYVVLGMGFGILMSANGFPIFLTGLMSVVIFAGSMQYVSVNLLATGASLLSAALMALLVNARHLFYGISMISRYKDMGWRKPYAVFALTDETYSLVCSDTPLPDGVDYRDYSFLISLFNQCYWVIGSLIGAILGSTLSFNSKGIDFSMTALFLVIFLEQWEKNRQHLPALCGLLISALCVAIFGPGNFLLPAMIGIIVFLFLCRKKIQGGAEK